MDPRRAGLFWDEAQTEAEAVPCLAQALAAQHQAQVAKRTTNKERIANSLRGDIEVDVVIVTGQAPVLGAANDRALRFGLGELSTHGLTGSPELIAHAVADLVGSVSAPPETLYPMAHSLLRSVPQEKDTMYVAQAARNRCDLAHMPRSRSRAIFLFPSEGGAYGVRRGVRTMRCCLSKQLIFLMI